MGLGELLMAQHRWGHTRARRVLGALELSETKTVGSLPSAKATPCCADSAPSSRH